MKLPTQSDIDAARRHADARVARARQILTKDGAAGNAPEWIAWEAKAAITYGDLEAIAKLINDDRWIDCRCDDGFTPRDVILEIVAGALERGELPPKPLAEYAAKALRQAIKENVRGTLLYRDSCIAGLMSAYSMKPRRGMSEARLVLSSSPQRPLLHWSKSAS